jgi:hypothetical protein
VEAPAGGAGGRSVDDAAERPGGPGGGRGAVAAAGLTAVALEAAEAPLI